MKPRIGSTHPTDFLDLEGHEAVVDVDVAAQLHHLGDVLVVEPQVGLVTVVHVLVVQRQLNGLPLLQLHLGSATLNPSRERERYPDSNHNEAQSTQR